MKNVMLRVVLLVTLVVSGISVFVVKLDKVNASPSTVTAASLQRWKVSNGYYSLSFFGDGTLLAAHQEAVLIPGQPGSAGVMAAKMNPVTGWTNATLVSADVRAAIRLSSSPSEQDWIIGGYANRFAIRQDGSFVKLLTPIGCCNVPRYPFAFDHVNDRAYDHSSSNITHFNVTTDVWQSLGVTSNFFGSVSLADATTVYTAGQQGKVERMNFGSGLQWTTLIASTTLQPGAVASDGSFIVSSGPAHFAGSTEPGQLARVLPDGQNPWNHMVNAVTPPVIGGNGLIFVGTQPAPIDREGAGAIEAYDPASGSLVWSAPVVGLPNDLLVGDDGAVYAATGSFNNGRVYTIGQGDGVVRQIITDVQGAWEIVLRAGLIYASGKSEIGSTTSITAIPVAANNYDVNSPWPVRYHDNQRTSNRTHPILTPSRIPPPDPIAPITSASTSPAANAAGWNNANVNVTLSATDNAGGSGVKNITYSSGGAQSTASTVVNGSNANLLINAEGSTTVTYFAKDNAGNVEAAKTLVIKIDKTAPTISITSPTNGSYVLNQAATVGFSCSDGISGIASCTGSAADGSALDTATTGSKSITVSAVDRAGNTSSTTVNYTVGYGVQALYDQTRAHKSGSTIPIKIQLVDANGVNVSSPSLLPHAISVIQTSSQASTEFGDAGNSNPDFDFRYDANLGGYIFNLQTTGFGTGSYLLNFIAGSSPGVYSVGFQIRR